MWVVLYTFLIWKNRIIWWFWWLNQTAQAVDKEIFVFDSKKKITDYILVVGFFSIFSFPACPSAPISPSTFSLSISLSETFTPPSPKSKSFNLFGPVSVIRVSSFPVYPLVCNKAPRPSKIGFMVVAAPRK